jgi:GSH-dependent disulfide-bond oxidoreductase
LDRSARCATLPELHGISEEAMLKFYYNLAPNPTKVALCLEEMELPYELVPIDTRKGEQHEPAFLAINPNAKLPAIIDGDATVFDSNAILLYLAEKTGKFLPASSLPARGELLSWLMFVASGIGPYSGQAVHFRNVAPEPKDYAVNRYTFEAQRHWGILNERLGQRRFMLGDIYTIVDMAVWGWSRLIPNVLGPDGMKELPNVKRHLDEVGARPAAARALALKDRHGFKTEMDAAARLAMFPHLAKKVA